jgi:hypothetical protein
MFSAGMTISTACGLLVIGLTIEMLADWAIPWPWAEGTGLAQPVRILLTLGILIGVAYLVIKESVLPLVRALDNYSLALAVEREDSSLGGRLVAAVQLDTPGGLVAGTSPSLVRALIAETERLTLSYDFSHIVNPRPLYWRASGAAIVVLAGFITFFTCLPGSAILLGRAFGSTQPVPRQTRVEVKTGDVEIARGDGLEIIAQAHGIHPSEGRLEETDATTHYTFPMDRDASDSSLYIRKIDAVTSSFDYRIFLNDGRSDIFHVKVVDRPAMLTMNCLQIYPAYIGLPDAQHLPGDLSILAGSRLEITVKANKELKSTTPQELPFNRVHLSGVERDFPLTVDASDPTTSHTADVDGQRGIPLPPGATGISVFLVDKEGMETKDPIVYRLDLVPDKPPKVRVTNGDWQEELVTRAAVQHIEYSVGDDWGLGKIALRYVVNDGLVQEVPIAIEGHPKSAQGHIDLPIKEVPLAAQQNADDRPVIKYWIYAEDLNTVSTTDGQPGHMDSDKFSLKVVTDDEKRAELMSKFGNITSDQLNAITTEQQQNSSQLGQTILHGTEEPATKP